MNPLTFQVRGKVRIEVVEWKSRQRGAVLIIGLILLVVLAMIGMTGMQTTTQQERMAGNMRDRNVGFQSAEAALRLGELEVQNGVSTPLGSGYYDSAEGFVAPADSALATDAVWAANSKVVGAVHGSSAPPAYKIEKRPPIRFDLQAGAAKSQEVYKVTARGVGASPTAVVVLQSSYLP